ncbi:MAG: electron transfer flavoprotein subunit alpha/FixB family protein [Formosimonas sp.]
MNQVISRVNPRRPIHLSAAGVPRIVLGEIAPMEGALEPVRAALETTTKPVRSNGPFTQAIVVATVSQRGQISDHAREVLAAAALLADAQTQVILAVWGEMSDDAAVLGADGVLNALPIHPHQWSVTVMTLWLAAVVTQTSAQRVLLADNEIDGDWARRYAAHTATPCTARVVALNASQARVRADAQHDVWLPATPLLVLERQVASTDLPFVGLGLQMSAPAVPHKLDNGIIDHGIEWGDAQTVALEEADFIISAGKGMQDLALFNQLAQALGAATGASRVAVDDGMFPRSRQIGATGKTVQASTYIALGISGAVQHLQGIKDCRHVIAVNLDPAAPIARRADLMVVADVQAWMQALLTEVHNRQGATHE